jgi:glycosyltransferase involved in cell wall biosynthesis
MHIKNDIDGIVFSMAATWLVFGDDWGVHPSTTQHLMLNMPPDHSVIWVNSIGMRRPQLNTADFRRLLAKGSTLVRSQPDQPAGLYVGSIKDVREINPRILPWHENRLARRINRQWFKKNVATEIPKTGSVSYLLTANPVLAYYHDVFPVDKIIYLRLDDYTEYPGCDASLVRKSEDKMFLEADLIVATAKKLLPTGEYASKGFYLPQGVQADAFDKVPLEPPSKPVLGFFGSIAQWLDFELIKEVAHRVPDWRLEFVGNPDFIPDDLLGIDNIVISEPVPFSALSGRIAHWSAAWIPFKINKLTISVNPLKVREYLAAGLPTHCTPLPEVAELDGQIFVSADAGEIVRWLRRVTDEDSQELRLMRRNLVTEHTWRARSRDLLTLIST